MADGVQAFRPGTPIKVHKDLDAWITKICVEGADYHITYECAWIHGGARVSAWFQPEEPSEATGTVAIGFKP